MGRGYGITPPAYWLLAAWHWSETGKPAYRGRYEYAKAWLLFMIKAYLIWKWEQARWLKGALGGGAKKKDWGRNRERRKEERKGERHLQIHIGGEVWKLECHSYLVTASEAKCWTFQIWPVWTQRSLSLFIRFIGYTTAFHPETTMTHLRLKNISLVAH